VAAGRPGGKVLVITNLVDDSPEARYATGIDLLFLLNTNGKRHTMKGITRLVERSGLRLESVHPIKPLLHLVEASIRNDSNGKGSPALSHKSGRTLSRRSVAVEDLALHLSRLTGGLKPEILIEDRAELVVDTQRLATAPGPVQRLHEPDVERLVQPMRGHQPAQFTDEFTMPIVGQIGVDSRGHSFQPLLL
jgi:hypothetical protein